MIFYIKMKYLIGKNVNNKKFLAELTFASLIAETLKFLYTRDHQL